MKKQLLNKILEHSRKRLKRHPEINNFPHYAYIVKNGKIISWARNCKIEPPVHYGYHRPWDGTYRPKYHAELAAFKKALVKPPFQIVNVRMNKQGLLRISKPCSACTKLMAALGCTKFFYSFQEGFLEYSPDETQ